MQATAAHAARTPVAKFDRVTSAGVVLGWGLLAAYVVAWVGAAASPGMAGWGFSVSRFLPPAAAWPLRAGLVLVLVPPLAEACGRRIEPLGDALVTSPLAAWAAAAAAALLVFGLDDRTWFIGDFLQRAEAGNGLDALGANFKGALPLDYLLHAVVPGIVGVGLGVTETFVTRIVGAVEAGALLLVAVSLARSLGLRGSGAVLCSCVVFFTGALTTFTGLGKPASEMCLLTAWAGASAADVARNGRGHAAMGTAFALALLTHRSGVLLAPVWAFAWLLHGGSAVRGPGRLVSLGLGLALPVVAAALVGQRIAHLGASYDLPHHLLTQDVVRRGGVIAAALDPRRLTDVLNLIAVFSPAMFFLPAALTTRFRFLGDPVGLLLSILVLTFTPVWLFVQPQHGIFRDWDVFASAGTTLCLFSGVALAESLASPRARRGLAAAIAVVVIGSSLAWLVHFHDRNRGIARARAYVADPRLQPEWVRALTWDLLMQRGMRLQQWADATDAAAHAAELAPHRRVLLSWGIAASMSGDDRKAEEVYLRLVARDSTDALGWLGLGGAALRLADTVQFRRATMRLQDYAPGSREAREILRHLRYFPRVWPGPWAPNKIARPG